MAQLDKFLQAMISRTADALVIGAESEAFLLAGTKQTLLTSKKASAQQVRRLAQEIIPRELRRDVVNYGRVKFTYAVARKDGQGSEEVTVVVSDWEGDTTIRAEPQQTAEQEVADTIAQSGLALAHDEDISAELAPPVAPPVVDLSPAPSTRTRGLAVTQQSNGNPHPIDELFRQLVQTGSSDLHMSSDEVPMIRKDGEMIRLDYRCLSSDDVYDLLRPIMPESNRQEFERDGDTDFAYEIAGLARFRANMFRDRKGVGAVFRTIPSEILTAEQLGLSQAIKDLSRLTKGLVLVTGPTGSGKSTTLCAIIDLINRTRSDHIITIEDPIEFVHPNKKCLVNQREVSVHTKSFKRALRAALREDPDIVLVGEMRDLETIAIAIETAETGHLVFGTLHTSTAYSTIDRIIDQFPPDQQEQIRVMLSESLRGVISQTLCKKIGGGRVAALEVLLYTPAVANLIREGKTFQIPSIMQTNRKKGMVLLNEALLELVEAKKITTEEAILKAVDKQTLKMMLKNANIPFRE